MKTGTRLFEVGLAFAVCLAIGFGWSDLRKGEMPDFGELPSAIVGNQVLNRELPPTETFRQVLANIDALQYGSAKRQDLTHAAVDGMIGSLNDPHTMLLEVEAAQKFQEKNHGEFVGIGAELAPDQLGARVRRVFKNSPASEAGLRQNDIVTKVGAKSVSGRDLLEVVGDIRGPSGSTVKLTLLRAGVESPITLVVARRRVQIQDVYGEILQGPEVDGKAAIGKLEVRSFSEMIVAQFDDELSDLEAQGIKGLIIDLRGNPGGLMSAAVAMAGRFVDNRVIASMKERDGSPEVFRSHTGLAEGRTYPVVILIDGGTASAAEILAGSLHDYNRATLVGTRSYGKGSVQIVKPLEDGAQLKITIARYYLPNGESVQRKETEDGEFLSGGLKPDVEVKSPPNAVQGDLKTDAQLRKAAEIIYSKLR